MPTNTKTHIQQKTIKNTIEAPDRTLSKKTWVLQMSRAIGAFFAKKQFAVMREVSIELSFKPRKTAPPHYKAGHYRLDIVAVNRRFDTVIVETKSCRSDFQHDEKWQAYLPLCNKFFFAADPKTALFIADYLKANHFTTVGVIEVSTTLTNELYRHVRIIKPARTMERYFDERELLWRMAARGSGFNYVGQYFLGNSFEVRQLFTT